MKIMSLLFFCCCSNRIAASSLDLGCVKETIFVYLNAMEFDIASNAILVLCA